MGLSNSTSYLSSWLSNDSLKLPDMYQNRLEYHFENRLGVIVCILRSHRLLALLSLLLVDHWGDQRHELEQQRTNSIFSQRVSTRAACAYSLHAWRYSPSTAQSDTVRLLKWLDSFSDQLILVSLQHFDQQQERHGRSHVFESYTKNTLAVSPTSFCNETKRSTVYLKWHWFV